jgi:putative Holliday junction resolvase
MGTILAIDYGLKRVGLAISDPERKFAFPCDLIENKNSNYLITQINNFILEKEVDLVLIGMPYNMNKSSSDLSKNEMEKNVESFINLLSKSVAIPIKVVDERLSSFAAGEKLREAGLSAKKSKKYIDSEAARLLLEEFIQNQS